MPRPDISDAHTDATVVIVVGSSSQVSHRVVGSAAVGLARHSPVPLIVDGEPEEEMTSFTWAETWRLTESGWELAMVISTKRDASPFEGTVPTKVR